MLRLAFVPLPHRTAPQHLCQRSMQPLSCIYVYALASCNCSAAFQQLPGVTAQQLPCVCCCLVQLCNGIHACAVSACNCSTAFSAAASCTALPQICQGYCPMLPLCGTQGVATAYSNHTDAVARATPQQRSCLAACNCSATPSAAASCKCSAAPLPMLLPHATACCTLLPT